MLDWGRHFGRKACEACAEVRTVMRAWHEGWRDKEGTNLESFRFRS